MTIIYNTQHAMHMPCASIWMCELLNICTHPYQKVCPIILYSVSVVWANQWLSFSDYTVKDGLRILLLAVDSEITLLIRSIHMRLTAPKDLNRCCCTTRFSILSSQTVVLFGRPYLALARLPVSMNLSQTRVTVLRLMFICKAPLISVRLWSTTMSLPRPIIS